MSMKTEGCNCVGCAFGQPCCARGCPEEMKCAFVPPCGFFAEDCGPCSTNHFQRPMWIETVVETGSCAFGLMFCTKSGEFLNIVV